MTVPERSAPAKAVSAWNIANALTVLRLLIVPVMGWFLLRGEGQVAADRWIATGLFAVAMITDRIDGDLARSRGLVTDFGKVVDPIADKTLVSVALLCLSQIGDVPWWLTLVVLVREWGVTLVRFWVIRHGVMAAGRGGKVKTFLQALGIGFMLMPHWAMPLPSVVHGFAWAFLIASVVVAVVTGVDYVGKALVLRQTSDRALAKRAARQARRAERRAGK